MVALQLLILDSPPSLPFSTSLQVAFLFMYNMMLRSVVCPFGAGAGWVLSSSILPYYSPTLLLRMMTNFMTILRPDVLGVLRVSNWLGHFLAHDRFVMLCRWRSLARQGWRKGLKSSLFKGRAQMRNSLFIG